MEPLRPSPGVLPLRPMTFGELLDAAILLLRLRGRLLIPAALVLAGAEQALIRPLRQWAGMYGAWPRFYDDQFGRVYLAIIAGLGTEAVVLALLGALTGLAAGASVLGSYPSDALLLRTALRRIGPLSVLALTVGAMCAAVAGGFGLAWPVIYGMVGMSAPAMLTERVGPFRALGRSFALSVRAGRMAFGLRFGAYLSWLVIRLALSYGGLALLEVVVPDTRGWELAISWISWILVNTIAYAVLASFDAVLYLEMRMRSEGLDIRLQHGLRTRRPVDLAVRR